MNNIVKPKDIGGLGLRRLDDMNKAFLLKLGWHLQTDGRKLWSEVPQSKYQRNTSNVEISMNIIDSSFWKNLVNFGQWWMTLA